MFVDYEEALNIFLLFVGYEDALNIFLLFVDYEEAFDKCPLRNIIEFFLKPVWNPRKTNNNTKVMKCTVIDEDGNIRLINNEVWSQTGM